MSLPALTNSFQVIASPKGTIRSVGDWLKAVEKVRQHSQRQNSTQGGRLWYRGHYEHPKFRLKPTIGRKVGRNALDEFTEEQILHRFRRWSHSQFGTVVDDWDALFMGRHHGLWTRILDWTESPLVALFFATHKMQKADGAVWITGRRDVPEANVIDVLEEKRLGSRPLKLFSNRPIQESKDRTCDAVKLLYPFYNSARLIAQSGMFTLHSNPAKPLDQYANVSFLEDRLDISFLTSVVIPESSKTNILRELDSLCINDRTLFPDLDGIIRTIHARERMWHPTPLP